MTDENSPGAPEPEPQEEPGQDTAAATDPAQDADTAAATDPAQDADAAAATDPAQAAGLLREMRVLRRSARSARHAYWFPLVLFGVLTCAAVPFYILPSPRTVWEASAGIGDYGPLLGGHPGFLVRNYLGFYWLFALLAGLTLTLMWYRRHARRIGLKTPARGYVITVGVLTGLAFVLPVLSVIPRLRILALAPGDLTIRGTFPFLIIAAGLCVLAWAERSRALAVIAAVYTGTALLASLYDIENVLFRLGWNPTPYQWRLTSLPNVLLPALVLLISGAGAFLVQRRQRRPA